MIVCNTPTTRTSQIDRQQSELGPPDRLKKDPRPLGLGRVGGVGTKGLICNLNRKLVWLNFLDRCVVYGIIIGTYTSPMKSSAK